MRIVTRYKAPNAIALLYVSDPDAGKVFVYSYPALKPAGMLTGINAPTGMCVDKTTGNVWITKTIRTLQAL